MIARLRRPWVLLLIALALPACAAPAETTPTSAPATELMAVGPTRTVAVPTEVDTALAGERAAEPAEPPPTVTSPPPTAAAASGSRSLAQRKPPPYQAPLALRPTDHFYFGRPLASSVETWLNSTFRYGNTHFGEEPTHAGVDILAERGTPVLAAGSGEVVWTGYGLYRGIADETDPYGLAVAIRHDFGYQGNALFTVYGHLEEISVWRGQPVEEGQVIGSVGDTGRASATHVHFEVRLGENRYFHSRNPELWMVPPEGWGVLVLQVHDSIGQPLYEFPVRVVNLDTGRIHDSWTYAKDTVHPDEYFEENLVMSDLPAGPYEIQINFVGNAYRAQLYLNPGQTNVVRFTGRQGFSLEASQ